MWAVIQTALLALALTDSEAEAVEVAALPRPVQLRPQYRSGTACAGPVLIAQRLRKKTLAPQSARLPSLPGPLRRDHCGSILAAANCVAHGDWYMDGSAIFPLGSWWCIYLARSFF